MSNSTLIQNQYKTLSKRYDLRFRGYIEAVTVKILTNPHVASSRAILDLGCGTGEILLRIARRYPSAELAGIDLSEEMLKLAGAKLDPFKNVSLTKGAIETLPYSDNHFDVVFSSGVVHYVQQAEAMTKEAYRVLKPEGHFLLIDMAQESLATRISSALRKVTDPGAVQFYSQSSASKLLTSQGFTFATSELFNGGYFGLYLVDGVKPSKQKSQKASLFDSTSNT